MAKKRRGSDLTMQDLTAAATSAPGVDGADGGNKDDPSVRMGSGACVKQRMSCWGHAGDGDTLAPLALKTPREASHLVK